MLGKMQPCQGYFWLFLGSDGGPQGLEICDLWSLGVGEIDICGVVGICTN